MSPAPYGFRTKSYLPYARALILALPALGGLARNSLSAHGVKPEAPNSVNGWALPRRSRSRGFRWKYSRIARQIFLQMLRDEQPVGDRAQAAE